ncbi:MAG: SDR family oxidoreductase [Myxococcaceae bacterium]
MNWKDTKAVVTGASRGLGAALVAELSARGASVVAVARGREALDGLVRQLKAEGRNVFGVVADVADKDSTHRIAGEAQALIGEVNLVIHNASELGPVPLRPLLDTDCEDLERVLQANLVGPFRLTKALAAPMALKKRGTVVHLSSDAAVEAYPAWGAYGVSKAAQDHLARILAAELEGTGVRVFSVDPGEMDTKMHADAIPEADPKTLLKPLVVAQRIARLIEQAPAGPVRVKAEEWS